MEKDDILRVFEYENECSDLNDDVNEVAYCGKCSRPNQKILFNDLFVNLTSHYVCFAYKTKKSITDVYFTFLDRSGDYFSLPVNIRTLNDNKCVQI